MVGGGSEALHSWSCGLGAKGPRALRQDQGCSALKQGQGPGAVQGSRARGPEHRERGLAQGQSWGSRSEEERSTHEFG